MNSHIQVPNGIIKNFRIDVHGKKRVFFLDLESLVIRDESSKYIGAQEGFYSESIDVALNKYVETPITKLIADIKRGEWIPGAVKCGYNQDKAFEILKNYCLAGIARSDSARKNLEQNSVYAPFVNEQFKHDVLIAVTLDGAYPSHYGLPGININECKFCILKNENPRPFILNRSGMYSVKNKGDMESLVFPVAPDMALMFVPSAMVNWELSDGSLPCISIDDSEGIAGMNIQAIKFEYIMNPSLLISNSKEELEGALLFINNNVDQLEEFGAYR